MNNPKVIFNPPPGWPSPPEGWSPPKGWTPDPSWPAPPAGWQLWIPEESSSTTAQNPSAVPDTSNSNPLSARLGNVSNDATTAKLLAENAILKEQLNQLSGDADLVELNDDLVLQNVGIYRYHHPLESALLYKERLSALSSKIAELIKTKEAIEKSNMFTFDNSLAKGRKMTNDLANLMLRAYNAEVDSSLRALRAGNVVTAKGRIERSREAIAKLGAMMEMRISDSFHRLRLQEVELTADFLMKKQEEKEAAREERARLREEKKVAAELAKERERLDKERSHILNALEALKGQGESDGELELRLNTIDEAIAQNDYRAANVRAGYVYVISNRGAFGPNVVKIGLTRRLEPIERVNELGGASVPFRFDVHALFFSEDAVTLESELHQNFADRRVNLANARKEFFFVSPGEVRVVLEAKFGNLLEFSEHADSIEFLQSVSYWERKPEWLKTVNS